MAARALAEHGADVLKITAEHLDDSPGSDIDTGLGKRSARLDLRRRDDLERLRALVREADVFLNRTGRARWPRMVWGLNLGRVAAGARLRVVVGVGPRGPVARAARVRYDRAVGQRDRARNRRRRRTEAARLPADRLHERRAARVRCDGGAGDASARRRRPDVRVSLARTGQWIVDRGMLAAAAVTNLPTQLPEAVTAPFLMESDSPFGRLRHLRPVVEMAETPAHWPVRRFRSVTIRRCGATRAKRARPRTVRAGPTLAARTCRATCRRSPDFFITVRNVRGWAG